jgi:hypothetical protein
MNLVSFILPQIETPLQGFKPVCKCLVHTILFLRILESTTPLDVMPPEFDRLDYVANPRFQDRVDEVLETLRGLFRKKKFVQLTISIYRVITEGGWFSREEKVEWERWTIPIRHTNELILPEEETRSRIQLILQTSDKSTDHYVGGKHTFEIYDASEEKGWTFADLADLVKKGPPRIL